MAWPTFTDEPLPVMRDALNVEIPGLEDRVFSIEQDRSTDGTSPLRFSNFLRAASGDQNLAFQNAMSALFASSGTYRRTLDMEGITATITEPYYLPAPGTFAVRVLRGGGIEVDAANWVGEDYIIESTGSTNHAFHIHEMDINGNDVASWAWWDNGNFFVIGPVWMRNCKQGPSAGVTGPPGLCPAGAAGAGLFTNGIIWMTTREAQTTPSQRRSVAIDSYAGDQKFFGIIASYFKHSLIYRSSAVMIDHCHFFQGLPGEQSQSDHTASIMFTEGYSGSYISGLYLGKSFIELSNLDRPDAVSVGGLSFANCKAYIDNGETGFSWVRGRDYQGATGLSVKDVSITDVNFVNRGATNVIPTSISSTASFDRNAHSGIEMHSNTFEGPVTPQSNPVTMNQAAGAGTSTVVAFNNHFPFDGRPSHVKGLTFQRSVSTDPVHPVDVQAINRAGKTATVVRPVVNPGTYTVTATLNPQESGFVSG